MNSPNPLLFYKEYGAIQSEYLSEITLRDLFAAFAINFAFTQYGGPANRNRAATTAYEISDAMLKARSKK